MDVRRGSMLSASSASRSATCLRRVPFAAWFRTMHWYWSNL